jgi:hypothetical protein
VLGAGCSRVTHPFAARVPRRAFPLDLHVLSTPPAFVLSQDQTLRWMSIAPRWSPPLSGGNRAGRLEERLYKKGNPCFPLASQAPARCHSRRRGCALYALAFSTLLSSQETDAHLRRTFIRLWGFQRLAFAYRRVTLDLLRSSLGNHSTLPGRESLVNSVSRTSLARDPCPTTMVQPLKDLRARRKPYEIDVPGWLPGTARLRRPTPSGQEEL